MLPRIALVAAVLAVSLGAPLVRLAAPASGLVVAALRVAIAAAVLNLAAPGALRQLVGLPRRERWLIGLAGLLLGIHFGVWISSLFLTSVASSVTLVSTHSVFAALFGAAFLRDRVGARAIAGIAIAVVGTAVLAGGDLRLGGSALWGDALAVIGAATAGGYLVVGRALRGSIPLLPYLALVNTVAAVVLGLAAVASGQQFLGFTFGVYAAIVACAVSASLIGHSLLNWSVRRIPAHLVALATLGEPIGATLLTWLFIGEIPPISAAVGGAIVLAGIAIGFSRGRA